MSKISIATFNIWKNDGNFPKRIHKLAKKLEKKELDIICFQEDFNSKEFSSSKLLNSNLDFNYLTTKTRKKLRDSILSSSNLTVLSRYEIKLLDEIYFNKNSKDERAYQIIEIKVDKKKILLINTHLCHKNSTNRKEQIKKILKHIKKYEEYDITMFCGDLNAMPKSEEIELIKAKGFKSKNIQYSHENGVTIDYIFYKTKIEDIEVKSKIILKEFSDHFCLVNSFRF